MSGGECGRVGAGDIRGKHGGECGRVGDMGVSAVG